ncbi:MAG: carboxypeptidase-like regulatory domain-containing protein, partial [Planctomycetota bacterium]
LRAGSEHFTLVFDFELRNREPRELHLTAVPAAHLAGMVVDEEGNAVEGAEVLVRLGAHVLTQSTSGERFSANPDRTTVTATDGSFSLRRVPCDESSRLRVSAAGFAATVLPVPETGDLSMVIQLVRPEAEEHAVEGTVQDEDQKPVEGAWVCAGEGGAAVQTDAAGRFVASYDPDATRDAIAVRAISPGYLPAEVELAAGERGPVTLTVGERALGLSGSVVEPDGTPVRSASVWLSGLKPFGGMQQDGGGFTFLLSTNFEDVMTPGSVPLGAWELGSDGRFSLEGLRDAAYTLHAVDQATLRMVTIADVAAGSHGLLVTLPAAKGTRALEGVVVDGLGTPVPDTAVRVELIHGTSNPQVRLGPQATSDAEGRFRFEGLAPTNVRITAWSKNGDFQPGSVELTGSDAGGGLEVLVHRTLRARFVCEDPRFAEGVLALLDEEGDALRISVRVSTSTILTRGVALMEGRSSVVILDDRARVARLRSAGHTIEMPLSLDPTILNEVVLR